MATQQTVVPLRQVAVVVDDADNVAVVKSGVDAGLAVRSPDGREIRLSDPVAPGHRFATSDIPAGTFVRQYGQPIGTSKGIAAGDAVSAANMSNDVPVVRDLPADLHAPAPEYLPDAERRTFLGYRRADGRIGTRNYILVVPTSMCASHESQQIATIAEFTTHNRSRFPNVDGVVAIPHTRGCGCSDGSSIEVTLRMLANYAAHPNVGGVLFIGLGCEKTNLSLVERHLHNQHIDLAKPVVRFGIQETGGTQAVIERGVREVEAMLPDVDRARREPVPVSELVLGVKCGGSDGFSGLSANPAGLRTGSYGRAAPF
jgi:altronate hydrolase